MTGKGIAGHECVAVVRAKNTLSITYKQAEHLGSAGRVSGLPGDLCEEATGLEGPGMVSAKNSLVYSNKVSHLFNGALEVTRISETSGEIVSCPEGMGMLRPQCALYIRQKFGEQPYGVFGVAYLADAVRMLKTCFQGIGMVGAQCACQVGNEWGLYVDSSGRIILCINQVHGETEADSQGSWVIRAEVLFTLSEDISKHQLCFRLVARITKRDCRRHISVGDLVMGGLAKGGGRRVPLVALLGGLTDGECLLGRGPVDQGVPDGLGDAVDAGEVNEVIEGQIVPLCVGGQEQAAGAMAGGSSLGQGIGQGFGAQQRPALLGQVMLSEPSENFEGLWVVHARPAAVHCGGDQRSSPGMSVGPPGVAPVPGQGWTGGEDLSEPELAGFAQRCGDARVIGVIPGSRQFLGTPAPR